MKKTDGRGMTDMYDKERKAIVDFGKRLITEHLTSGTSGNISIFDPGKKLMIISPSGIPYFDTKESDIVVVGLDGKIVEGKLRPSSDTPTHIVLYKEFAVKGGCKVGGIIHTHSPAAVGWAQAMRAVPLFGTTHADHIQTEIPCTSYLSKEAVERDYEKETGTLIVEHFKQHGYNPAETNMVLVGGHGPFAWGSDAAKAVYNGVVLEEVCKMALNTILVNPGAMQLPDYIVNKHYMRKHGPAAYYGQQNR